jgi:hypothetical protein
MGMIIASNACYAQSEAKVQPIQSDFVTENNCPLHGGPLKTDLEIDPFNQPIAARVYLDYQNGTAKTIVAIKFRVRFVDGDGQTRGSFQAFDTRPLAAGQSASQKWRREGIDPHTSRILVRALQVKFDDASIWESEKIQSNDKDTAGGSLPSEPAGRIEPTPAQTLEPKPLSPAPEVENSSLDLRPSFDLDGLKTHHP